MHIPSKILLKSALLASLFAGASGPALAQRAGENAVKQAQDAFGFSVGGETVGIYSMDNVRGFSPATAGNIRIEGLYADRQGYHSGRIIRSTSVKVGLNTLGYLFPAPSGIADFALRAPAETTLSVVGGLGDYASPFVDIDGGLASPDGTFRIAAGVSIHPEDNSFRGHTSRYWNAGAVPRWQVSDDIVLTAFFDREKGGNDGASPIFFAGGPYLPPRIKRRLFVGQSWSDYRFHTENEGLIGEAALGDGWTLKAGAFHSVFNPKRNAYDMVRDIQPDGAAQRAILLTPEQRFASTSGDVQLQHSWTAGRARHTLTASVRGRDYRARNGGETLVPLGPYQMNDPVDFPEPDIEVEPAPNRDRVRQRTGGLTYRLEWAGALDIGLGLQKTDYRKIVRPGNGAERSNHSAPWLYNATAAWRIKPSFIVYSSYARGLEESGAAPGNAVNAGEVLPAIQTKQAEIGLRTGIGPFTLTSAAFDISRPYAAVDADDVFRLVGKVRHRGVEASLAGQPAQGLFLLGGLLLIDQRVTGEEVDAGLRGKRPIGAMPISFQGSADYALPFLPGVSVDASINVNGKRTSRRDNLADVPARTLVGMGARYRFTAGGQPVTLRGSIANLFDTYGLTVVGSGNYHEIAGRRWRLTLSTDF
ncbi:TonB-dependent receptor [Allosphingosinicella flava]|uniref:TonB-dependent receptor n=1 Tax=Allosphingosinicella flava TaxID=2771430 RepID=A0A7T2GJK9_9SPHN|nr:TonB-dependent receptor [Sphingosinicella flava]QPQ55081.1 TonB-dependent receptor [Sphingosinicella flava]